MFRSPAVAGRFYPAEREQLHSEVSAYLRRGEAARAIGIVSPHAGYVFSGGIAGETFSKVEVPDTVVVLGPNHYGVGAPLALWQGEGWETPLGKISIDQLRGERLLELCHELEVDCQAHRQEHSLEVQVPFIQTINPAASLVAIAVGMTPLSSLKHLGEALAVLVNEAGGQILVVASSDMTHFESAESAAQKDRLALEHVTSLDPEGLFRTVRDQHISMCGVLPVVAMLYAARQLGSDQATLVRYGTSAQATGDYEDVVGYAGVVVR